MDILYLLIPLSAVLLLAIVGVFGWAVFHGQFEDVQREGERILTDD
ncbi:MAG: cbb3-type cytochrome oxidase assembly protein CcoS [Rubrivivax sp.]|jgi:cbb3-type cytochrome oxidase maturation protein|nr:cbb3-type cytochrome oxidase assembly protein CcoS [Rubrivivax sp.]